MNTIYLKGAECFIPDHFGSIMLTTSIALPSTFTPLQRILLTANGNLQLLLSSFHNSPVTIKILKNILINDLYYDRCVGIECVGRLMCTAYSKVFTKTEKAKELVVSGKVGIGQLFRYLKVLPEFELIGCGLLENKAMNIKLGFWRRYVLSSEDIKCEIYEEFEKDCLDNE